MKTVPGINRRRLARGAGGLVCVLLTGGPVMAQSEAEADPCGHVYGQVDLGICWAREAERAENEMNQAYLSLRQKLPGRAAESLEKAQELWREFLEAHLGTLYDVESPSARQRRELLLCLTISRATLYRERARQLERILEPDALTICPL